MKALGIIINIFLPGFGTLLVKKFGAAFMQIVLFVIGALLTVTAILSFFGIPMIFIAWIWSLVTVAGVESDPVQVVVQQQQND